MRYLDLTLPTAAENLALDEALLEEAESLGQPAETLRVWEPTGLAVVVGRSSKIADEVHVEACLQSGVPILRRTSGGAAVVLGPGCLMYALVVSLQLRPELRAVNRAHRWVRGTLAEALGRLVPGVCCRGTSDLAIDCENETVPLSCQQLQKVSGNSVRLKREHFLYHGTLLYNFPLEWADRLLAMPPRQPEYRRGRAHGTFLANLPLDAASIRQALTTAFEADDVRPDWPQDLTGRLVAERYARPEWNA
jgi:lipoate-protein ligase A